MLGWYISLYWNSACKQAQSCLSIWRAMFGFQFLVSFEKHWMSNAITRLWGTNKTWILNGRHEFNHLVVDSQSMILFCLVAMYVLFSCEVRTKSEDFWRDLLAQTGLWMEFWGRISYLPNVLSPLGFARIIMQLGNCYWKAWTEWN